jgi:GntR family transcriptional repressor for pyruvate dehydrogenase complex
MNNSIRIIMFKKISPRKISDEIIEQFKGLLSSGELKPGDELPSERELAESIGVSRPPLREALNALQALGLVEIRPRSKIIVRSLAEKSVQDPISLLIEEDTEKLFELLEIRRAMENWVAYKAAQRANPEDIQKLEKLLKKDQDNLRHNRDDAKTDADFHVTIALATHNTLFSHLMASCYYILWNTQKVSREKIFKKEGNRKLIASQHVKIFEAIREGAADRAAKEARNHIDFVERELRKVLAVESSAS